MVVYSFTYKYYKESYATGHKIYVEFFKEIYILRTPDHKKVVLNLCVCRREPHISVPIFDQLVAII